MKKWLFLIVVVLITGSLPAGNDGWAHQAKEPVERRLTLDRPGEAVTLDVDNVIGSITVTAADGSDIGLSAVRLARAATAEDLQRAGREVKLEITQKDNFVRLYVDGPFRAKENRGQERRYSVRYDFTLTVPRRTEIRLKTVTGGDVRVSGTEGPFRVDNVNGRIVMNGMAGDGHAATVNGSVHADFRRGPARPCEFHTVNGDIDLAFPEELNADVRLKTLNGDAWSDFEFTALAANPPISERRDGLTRIAADHCRNLRLGKGGPIIAMETVNGDVTIARRTDKTQPIGE
jgi:hypothetical protein